MIDGGFRTLDDGLADHELLVRERFHRRVPWPPAAQKAAGRSRRARGCAAPGSMDPWQSGRAGRRAGGPERYRSCRTTAVGRRWPDVRAKVDEELPVDGPVGRDGAKSPQISVVVGVGRRSGRSNIRVELVLRTDHRVPEAVRATENSTGMSSRSFSRSLGIVVTYLKGSGKTLSYVCCVKNCGQEVVGQDPLVVPSDLIADVLEADVLLLLA